jgi:hypothetical protein
MSFRLRAEAGDWFKGIETKDGPIRTMFDQYYLCLMLGLATGRNERFPGAPEFVDYFVTDFSAVARLLVALLVIAEAKRLGVELADKGDVKRLLDDYLDPNHPANLTDQGFQKLNDYANGGFSELVEAVPERPRHVETFLQIYTALIADKMNNSDIWARYTEGASA